MRDIIGYNNEISKSVRTGTASIKEIWDCLVEVYEQMGMSEYIPILKEFILENTSKYWEVVEALGWYE